MELADLDRYERKHYAAICGAADSGGLSMAEFCDEVARLFPVVLHGCRGVIEDREQLRVENELLRAQLASQRTIVVHTRRPLRQALLGS